MKSIMVTGQKQADFGSAEDQLEGMKVFPGFVMGYVNSEFRPIAFFDESQMTITGGELPMGQKRVILQFPSK